MWLNRLGSLKNLPDCVNARFDENLVTQLVHFITRSLWLKEHARFSHFRPPPFDNLSLEFKARVRGESQRELLWQLL